MKTHLITSTLCLALAISCGNESLPDEVDRRDAGGSTPDATVQPNDRRFEVDVIEGLNSSAQVGAFATARVGPEGRPAVAYGFNEASQTEIHFAELQSDLTWSTELAVIPAENDPKYLSASLFGLGFDFVDGVPTLAYAGGDDDGQPVDVGLGDLYTAQRSGGQWTTTARVDGSAEAGGTCLNDNQYCAQGSAGFVGLYAHLKAGPQPGQYSVSYRDQHFGFGTEDLISADLEIWESGPGAQHLMVDGGRSGGNRSSIAFFPDGRSVVAYTLDRPEDRVSVWVGVEAAGDYERYQVSDHTADHRLSIDMAPDGTLWLAYFDVDSVDLVVASSSDQGETWTWERVDERGDVGLHPSLAVAPDGTVHVAYTYCGEASDRDCPGSLGRDSVVRLASKPAGATEWAFQTIDDGQGQGFVGEFNSLVVYDDGTLGVAFVDQRNSDLLFAREIE